MSNALYNAARTAFASGGINWGSDSIKVVGVTSGYTFSQSHSHLSDVAAGNRVATSAALSSPTETNGVLDAADITINSVTGSQIVAFVVYKDTGTESTSTLIAYLDHDGSSNPIAFTPNGSNLTISWNASGIATI